MGEDRRQRVVRVLRRYRRTEGEAMTEHLPECPILKPCCDDEEFPEHGFCGNFVGRCLHCLAECICDELRACEARVSAPLLDLVSAGGKAYEEGYKWGRSEAISAAREAVAALATERELRSPSGLEIDIYEAIAAIDALREGRQ